MTKYAFFFSYSPQALADMIKNPGDRAAAARAAVEPLGGTIESVYFMFGDHDGMVIYDVPDADSAAAVAVAVHSSGAFTSVETHELVEPERFVSILGKAGTVTGAYRVPGT